MLVRDVIQATVRVSGLTETRLLSHERTRRVARVRQVGMLVSSRVSPASLPSIGRRWGGRDHTTVVHAINRAQALVGAADQIAVETLTGLLEAIGLDALPAARPEGAAVRSDGRVALQSEIATLEIRLALARAKLAALTGAVQ
jgi:hypothetical protein